MSNKQHIKNYTTAFDAGAYVYFHYSRSFFEKCDYCSSKGWYIADNKERVKCPKCKGCGELRDREHHREPYKVVCQVTSVKASQCDSFRYDEVSELYCLDIIGHKKAIEIGIVKESWKHMFMEVHDGFGGCRFEKVSANSLSRKHYPWDKALVKDTGKEQE